MKTKILIALLIAYGGIAHADTYTPRMGLTKPTVGSTGWGPKINTDYDIIDSSVALQGQSNTFTSSQTIQDAALTLTGAGGSVVAASSVTAGTFWGNGSNITGVTATDPTRVLKAGDTMTGQLTISGSSLTVTNGVLASTFTAAAVPGFVGDASGITGYSVVASSCSADARPVNSLSFVAVSTLTVTLRGGRSLLGAAVVSISNASPAKRDYTVEVERGGVQVSSQMMTSAPSNDYVSIGVLWCEPLSVAGVVQYTISVKSISTAATQTANGRSIRVVEY